MKKKKEEKDGGLPKRGRKHFTRCESISAIIREIREIREKRGDQLLTSDCF